MQRVGGEDVVCSRQRLQRDASVGQLAYGLLVGGNLVVEAALELGTLACEFLRVRREVLQACSPRTDGREARHPCGAAEFASARPRTAYAAGFLTGTNLLHLDADAERLGIDLNQLPEIDTSVSNIVEDGFASVALVLHVTNLHLELHVLGNLSCPYHRFVLECMCLFGTLEVSLGSETVDDACLEMLDVDAAFAHLEDDELSDQRHFAYIVSGIAFHGHHLSFLEREVVDVAVVAFTGVLELNLHHIGLCNGFRQVGQVIRDGKHVRRVASVGLLGVASGFTI